MTTPNFFKQKYLGQIKELQRTRKSRKTSAVNSHHQKPPLSRSNFFTVVPKKLKLHSRILVQKRPPSTEKSVSDFQRCESARLRRESSDFPPDIFNHHDETDDLQPKKDDLVTPATERAIDMPNKINVMTQSSETLQPQHIEQRIEQVESRRAKRLDSSPQHNRQTQTKWSIQGEPLILKEATGVKKGATSKDWRPIYPYLQKISRVQSAKSIGAPAPQLKRQAYSSQGFVGLSGRGAKHAKFI